MGRPTPGRDFGRARAADAARRVLVNRAPHGSRPASRLRPLALSPLGRGLTVSDAIGRPLAGCGTTRPEPEVNVTRGSREVIWCNHKRGAIIRCSTPAEHRRASLLISMPGSCSSGGMICPMYFPDRKRGRGGSCSALLVRGGKNKFQSRYGRHNVFRDVDDNAANYTSGSDVPKVRFADHLSVLDYQLEIERGWRFRPVERLFTAFSGSEDRFLGSSHGTRRFAVR